MTNPIETRVCKSAECENEYQPVYLELLGSKILRGQGWCPDCAKRASEEMDAKDKAQLLAELAHTRAEMRKRTGIKPKFMNEDFSTFKKSYQDKALAKCIQYAESFPVDHRAAGYPSLIIFSKNSWGVGKTHLSIAIMHRILDRWQGQGKGCPRLVFTSEYDLFRSIQATYNFSPEDRKYRESEEDIIKRLVYCDLLVLDDVGKEARQDPRFVQRTLFAIIDGRYSRNMPMILTANKTPEQLKSHLGHAGTDEASFDRVWEMCRGKAMAIDGKSYRRG